MSERYTDLTPQQRAAIRRERKKKRMIRQMILAASGLICVAIIILAVCGIVNVLKSRNETTLDGNTEQTGISTQDTAPTTQATEPTVSRAEVDQLIADADFIAAGYDYQKAISMLIQWEHYEQFPELATKVAQYQELDSQLVVYPTPQNITHVFFHSLIVDTDRAFDGDRDTEGYHTYMTTVSEFIAMLEIMYERGYVLISPYDQAYEVTDESGTHFTYGEIRLPEGKTPFVMSQDDVNYYSYMISSGKGNGTTPYWVDEANDGFANRIVIGEDGYPTCEYVDAQGNVHYGDYDLVPILETFIQEHPDFSYHGARAILGVTGYEGVFGYRTKPSYEAAMGSEAYAAEVEEAKKVAQCLKDHGWIIASHSYAHYSYGAISNEKMITDSKNWEETVQPVVGETDIILYPNGSDIAGLEKYSFDNVKFDALYKDGYRYFYNVDSNIWNQLGSNYFRAGRRNLDGYRMYHHPHKLDDLFDVKDVWDDARPTTAPKI